MHLCAYGFLFIINCWLYHKLPLWDIKVTAYLHKSLSIIVVVQCFFSPASYCLYVHIFQVEEELILSDTAVALLTVVNDNAKGFGPLKP